MTNYYEIHQNLLKSTILKTQEIYHDIIFVSQAVGGFKTEKGFIKFGVKGTPDLFFFFLFKGELCAGFAEIKTGSGKLTKEQAAFKKRIEELNGLYIIVRNQEDLLNALRGKYGHLQ